jgi:hypothetical protein
MVVVMVLLTVISEEHVFSFAPKTGGGAFN